MKINRAYAAQRRQAEYRAPTMQRRLGPLERYGVGPTLIYPRCMQQAKVPVTIVCGPPASGKSSYVAAHASESDIVIDLDVILAEVSGQVERTVARKQFLRLAFERRADLVRSLVAATSGEGWLIVGVPEASTRVWWKENIGATRTIVLAVPAHECIARIEADPGRAELMTEQVDGVHSWWRRYQPAAGDILAAL